MTIIRRVLDEICAHAREMSPNECCGVLIGEGGVIVRALRARNIAPDSARYELAPEDHFAARRAARTSHLDVIGFYHSHPRSEAWPSKTDIAEASYPGAAYLIVGTRGGTQEARVFTLDRGRADEVPLTVVSEA